MGGQQVLSPGRNVWRCERAYGVRFLVDADEYFRAVAEALAVAQRTVFILGWDVDGRTLLPDAESGGMVHLADLLSRLAERSPSLDIFILGWDFSPIFALERQAFPTVQLGWATHKRVHFELDGHHPVGASHHQKVVVVDDRIAFCGGMDLTIRRWDTQRHDPFDARRVDPSGAPYEPFHDVQIGVQGPAAAALGALARERWERATKKPTPPIEPVADIRTDTSQDARRADDVFGPLEIGIARTMPENDAGTAVKEVEALFFDSIASAKKSIYVENQYASNLRIGDALAARLEEADGPEIVLVCPRSCHGWMEQRTMGRLRATFFDRLRKADRHGRLRIVSPRVGDTDVFIHSKVMIVDERLAHVGSSNFSNRSLGLDTECDAVIEAVSPESEAARAVRRLRARLMGEHLGLSAEVAAAELERAGSLRALVDAHAGSARCLAAIEAVCPESDNAELAVFADPAEPMDAARVLGSFVRSATPPRHPLSPIRRTVLALIASGVLLTVIGLTGTRPEELASRPVACFIGVVATAVLSQLRFPVMTIGVALGMLLGPWLGPAVALVGATLSAAFSWIRGRRGWILPPERPGAARAAASMNQGGLLSAVIARLVIDAATATVGLAAGMRGRNRAGLLVMLCLTRLPVVLAGGWLGYAALLAILGRSLMAALVFAGVGVILVAIGVAIRVFLARAAQRAAAVPPEGDVKSSDGSAGQWIVALSGR